MKTLLILAFSLLFYSASACECKVGYSMSQNFKDAALVMRVKVLSVNDTLQMGRNSEALRLPFESGFAPNLKVLEVFKGKMSKEIISLSGSEHCSEQYAVGRELVLFIYHRKDTYYTRICEKNFGASDQSSMKELQSILSEQGLN